MKSNSLLTYVLYGLLGAFILTAGYYACQKQKEQKELAAREAAELEETLREMGYSSEDTTSSGSSFVESDTETKTSEETKPEAPEPKTAVSKAKTEAAPVVAPKSAAPKTAAPSTSKPATTVLTPPTTTSKPAVSTVSGPGSGRWAVRAGTFTIMDGARRRLEEVIKAGYPDAEISKTKDGKAAVIVYRSNDKAAAQRVVDKLDAKGIDAAVFDRNK